MVHSGGFDGDDFEAMMDKINRGGVDDDVQEVNPTQPFQPDAASTPATRRGEDIEMQTMQHEKGGLPDDSYEEIPLLGAQSQI